VENDYLNEKPMNCYRNNLENSLRRKYFGYSPTAN